jgi:hypothetical protein
MQKLEGRGKENGILIRVLGGLKVLGEGGRVARNDGHFGILVYNCFNSWCYVSYHCY